MLIQTRSIVVTKGNADKVVERFSEEGAIDGMPGLLDIAVAVNTRGKEEEVLIVVRWASKEAWQHWEKSPEHLEGHKQSRGRPTPDFIVSTTVNMYEVRKLRPGRHEA